MKRNFSFRFIMLALVAVLFTVTSCKDYDDDIKKIEAALEAYKTNAANDLKATKAELEKKITDLKGDVTTLAGKVKTLEENSATKKELEDAKKELMAKLVSLETFNAYKAQVDAKLADLEAKLAKAATKDEVKALEDRLNAKIAKVEDELGKRIAALEGVLKLVNGESEVLKEINARLDGIDKSLEDHLAKINENKAAIEALKTELQEKYDELKGLIEANKTAIENLDAKVERYKKELDDKDKELEKMIGFNAANILTLSKQLEGLTFIPTRGLPSEKTMKLYYFAGDYTADHVLMYRVSPSNAKLGEDFTIESLNFQITTRSADDGVEDHSSKVDVHINGEVTQKGDIIYIPVHIKGAEACKVFGNKTWWGNEFFHGDNVLLERNFPPYVVRTIDGEDDPTHNTDVDVDYDAEGGNRGLSIVVTALTNDIKREEGQTPAKLRVKSTEHVHAELIPTQIKLAEARDGKGNVADKADTRLKERTLKFTLAEATTWALLDENNLPNNNKNWNVLAWSGNKGKNGWEPGEIDLYDYVSSFYYPQDGGDLTHEELVPGDPHRYLYSEFGKAFGFPYTDKPTYAKPIYKFEQMVYKDSKHNIVIGPEGGEGVTHSYAEIVDGHILRVFDNGEAIQGVRNKKLIIKVTQINSECKERQPVGYLVIKYTDDPDGVWPDVEHTIDFNHIPYFHKACETTTPVGLWIEKTYTDGDAGTTFTHKNALLELFTERKFMSPINAPKSYGLSGKINPGDVKVILGAIPQLNGIGEHNMGNIYNIQRRDASVVAGSVKFTAAAYNHVNDAENKAHTGVTPEEAFRHVMIRYEYTNHSYIVYVDDQTPAGDYEITYKLENKEGDTQHGNVLFLTFKFRVALRTIKAKHDTNGVNWLNENTIRSQHARIKNTIEPHDNSDYTKFRSDDGYRVDLRQSFVLKTGSLELDTETLPAVGGVEPGAHPNYRPMFEFVQDKKIVAAGFKYVRDDANYLTKILYKDDELAAEIINDAPNGFNYLYIKNNKQGDFLYNYLTQDIKSNDVNLHNVLTKWGKTELMLKDDGERLLPVRLVTDINATCLSREKDKFPNGNYYYIEDFNIKFERALRWAFTTVEMTDNQRIQGFVFDFETKDVKENDAESVYRGLFDHAYEPEHGYGNLVHPRWNLLQLWLPWDYNNPQAQAKFYGLDRSKFGLVLDSYPPRIFIDTEKKHELKIANLLGIPGVTVDGKYDGLDYRKVEQSTDGGNTWTPISLDYQVLKHNQRYFNVINVAGPISGKVYRVAVWQGDQTALTSPLYFRVPIVNDLAVRNGFAPVDGDTTKEYWMTYREEHAKVKGYAVFKINPKK